MACRHHLRDGHDADALRANERAGERHVRPAQQSTIPHANEAQRTSSGSPAKKESGLWKRLVSWFRIHDGVRHVVRHDTSRLGFGQFQSRKELEQWPLRIVSAPILMSGSATDR